MRLRELLARVRQWRPTRLQFVLAAALWIVLVPNLATTLSFARAANGASAAGQAYFVAGGLLTALACLLLMLLILGLPFRGRSLRWIVAIVLVIAAIPGYFSLFLGTLFDRNMLVNMLQTHPAEALELFTPRLALWVALVGVLPALVALRTTLDDSRSFVRDSLLQGAVFMAVLLSAGAVVASAYPRYASAARNKLINVHTLTPVNLVASGADYLYAMRGERTTRDPMGRDAKSRYELKKPRLVVLVLGETARAQNIGLNGYARDTTPRMRAANGFYFPDTQSCGTATAISVPCMFSGLTRDEFSMSKAQSRESLLDVVSHSGARVLWRDNDGGCKGVCDRIDAIDQTKSDHPKWCPELGNCFDELLFEGLADTLKRDHRDTFLVLHIKGSHGPAYYKRVPPAFERFQPVCRSADLASCDQASLINAYDNTIVYTDHFIGETIDLLNQLGDRFATALVYVSDHGESLGESGMYLHGMPYALAPREQTRVPFFAWVSQSYIALEKWSLACMAEQTKIPRSHDNLYSTVLGLLDIETSEYKRERDVFSPCD